MTHGLRVYAQAADARVSHLCTWTDQREVDVVVIAHGLNVLAVQVKLSTDVTRSDTATSSGCATGSDRD